MYQKLIGAIVLTLSLTTLGLCDACVTINKTNNTYVVDQNGCVQ